MNDDVRAAVLVKETLSDDLLLRGHHAERQLGRDQVLDDLFRRAGLKTNFVCEPIQTGNARALARIAGRLFSSVGDLCSQTRHGLRKFCAASRRFAQPEGD